MIKNLFLSILLINGLKSQISRDITYGDSLSYFNSIQTDSLKDFLFMYNDYGELIALDYLVIYKRYFWVERLIEIGYINRVDIQCGGFLEHFFPLIETKYGKKEKEKVVKLLDIEECLR